MILLSTRRFPLHISFTYPNCEARYYVLRDDMLGFYVEDISQRLAARQENDGWQVCIDLILSVSEGSYHPFT